MDLHLNWIFIISTESVCLHLIKKRALVKASLLKVAATKLNNQSQRINRGRRRPLAFISISKQWGIVHTYTLIIGWTHSIYHSLSLCLSLFPSLSQTPSHYPHPLHPLHSPVPSSIINPDAFIVIRGKSIIYNSPKLVDRWIQWYGICLDCPTRGPSHGLHLISSQLKSAILFFSFYSSSAYHWVTSEHRLLVN